MAYATLTATGETAASSWSSVRVWSARPTRMRAASVRTWPRADLYFRRSSPHLYPHSSLSFFPRWHALHCAAVTLAHFGRSDIYMRLRATFNKK